jgi:hypothetical protein
MAKSGGKEILFVSGTADIFGKELAVICGVTKNGEENGPPLTVFLGGVFPNQWSLVQAAPALKRIPVFKDIEFTKVGIIFSNAEVELESKIFPPAVKKFFENALGGNFDSLEAGEGLNFFGGLSFERIPLLKKAKQIFGLQPSLLVQGLVAKNLRESYITVNLPSFTTPSFFSQMVQGGKTHLYPERRTFGGSGSSRHHYPSSEKGQSHLSGQNQNHFRERGNPCSCGENGRYLEQRSGNQGFCPGGPYH